MIWFHSVHEKTLHELNSVRAHWKFQLNTRVSISLHTYLCTKLKNKGFKGTVVNRALTSLHGEIHLKLLLHILSPVNSFFNISSYTRLLINLMNLVIHVSDIWDIYHSTGSHCKSILDKLTTFNLFLRYFHQEPWWKFLLSFLI